MIKNNKKTIIICALVMLIPVIAGVILWPQLSDQLPTHWNFKGEVDGYSSKAFAVFGLNGMLFVFFVICVLATCIDPKNANISKKTFTLVVGIMPLISVYSNAIVLTAGLGKEPNVMFWVKMLLAIIFIVLGNYVPKMKQSYTVGIKLPWTLDSEENWNKTHRFAGRIMVVGGFVFLADVFLGFLNSVGAFLIVICLIVLAPTAYSLIYYLRSR